jgi:hypothetical protein
VNRRARAVEGHVGLSSQTWIPNEQALSLALTADSNDRLGENGMALSRLTHQTCLILAAGALLCANSGCHRSASVASAPASGATAVTVSTCELFTADLKRLEPHLGLTTGCVKLQFASEVFIGKTVEVWQDGKQIPMQPERSEGLLGGPGELTISLKEETDHNGVRSYRMVLATSGQSFGGSSISRIEMPDLGKEGSITVFFPAKLEGPIDLPEDKPAAVWAYLANVHKQNAAYSEPKGTIEQQVKQATWAVVVKVYWRNAKDR